MGEPYTLRALRNQTTRGSTVFTYEEGDDDDNGHRATHLRLYSPECRSSNRQEGPPDQTTSRRSVSVCRGIRHFLIGLSPTQASPKPGLRSAIAFTSTRDGAGELYLMFITVGGDPDPTQVQAAYTPCTP
jgi:hypothetical protein